jgi:hypothetical protein
MSTALLYMKFSIDYRNDDQPKQLYGSVGFRIQFTVACPDRVFPFAAALGFFNCHVHSAFI